MDLPVAPPIEPMLAKRIDTLPDGDGWLFEPKWDGFRALAFRDGAEWFLQSRDLKPLGRYFPELGPALLSELPERCVLDGEIVIAGAAPGQKARLDFDALLQRIHPAASRIASLAATTPASYVAFDLLCLGHDDLRRVPLLERRAQLEAALAPAHAPIHCTPATRDRAVAADWFARFEGAGLDGVIAKRLDGAYEPGKRVMLKIKHERTADCVVGGFRWHKGGENDRVGSLLLGLYDEEGALHHVGVAASFSAKQGRELVAELAPQRQDGERDHPWGEWLHEQAHAARRVPGAASRWNRDKDLSWVPLRPERAVEVSYDHMQGSRFRHTAHFVRWRLDKDPRSCRYDQLEVAPAFELARIFA